MGRPYEASLRKHHDFPPHTLQPRGSDHGYGIVIPLTAKTPA